MRFPSDLSSISLPPTRAAAPPPHTATECTNNRNRRQASRLVIQSRDMFVILELLMIESHLNVSIDSSPKNADRPRFRVMNVLSGFQRPIQLHERVLYQISSRKS